MPLAVPPCISCRSSSVWAFHLLGRAEHDVSLEDGQAVDFEVLNRLDAERLAADQPGLDDRAAARTVTRLSTKFAGILVSRTRIPGGWLVGWRSLRHCNLRDWCGGVTRQRRRPLAITTWC